MCKTTGVLDFLIYVVDLWRDPKGCAIALGVAILIYTLFAIFN